MTVTTAFVECPVCRSRMPAPEKRGVVVLTCREGHRFEWTAPARPRRPRRRRRTLAAAGVVIVALAALFAASGGVLGFYFGR